MNLVEVARLDVSQVDGLMRLVDLLAAIQVCWPKARVVLDGQQISVLTPAGRSPLPDFPVVA